MNGVMENILLINSHTFVVNIIRLYKSLSENHIEQTLPRQLLKSGTSIGALVREAQHTESRSDFVHKLGIAQKECDETIDWLEVLNETDDLTDDQFIPLKKDAESLLKILKSSILTAKKNMQK